MSLQSYTLFLRAFATSPKTVGALFPSAPSLSHSMTGHLDFLPTDTVVELGPGTGSFTRYILAKLATPSQYLGVELNADFTKSLQKQFPYASFSCGRAEEIQSFLSFHGHNSINHLISGLPFASLAAEDTTKIIESVTRACTNGATFTTFQYLHAFKFKNAKQFRARMKETFGPCVRVRVVLFNLFPAVVLTWRKTEKLV
ncbi:class I SAM-dependent methyltransferase [Vibrio marisflavi]|uniref:Methyltransferase domain-containing protein n=1 Tax=Vibrio marisflavi CECT 7928 TaxID=634439 RepID=A0ABM9A4J2_9VIBR|nr:rRNA adenine N-6-methyltransferase family protein [Vibrio marisflavi]CAH0539567.1 hypothetical protein VMF7928_02247 [Vibrio marisflavi CECT 7928]